MDELYSDKPDGLCGNEDCGQMSAWYVFSAMGFYPVNPANGEYVFGKPFFEDLTLHLENGKSFRVQRKGAQDEQAFVKEIFFNGVAYHKAYIRHQDIMEGGDLIFIMADHDPISFEDDALPHSAITEELIVPLPAIRGAERAFTDSTLIRIEAADADKIFYRINGGEELLYQGPFTITKECLISMYAIKNQKYSKTVEAHFYKIPKGRKVSLKNILFRKDMQEKTSLQ
jgi:hypothetical protein